MLRGIAVYDIQGKNLKRIASAPTNKFTLFDPDPFKGFEEDWKDLNTDNFNILYRILKAKDNFYYFSRLPDTSQLVCVASRKQLYDDEPFYLIHNITQIFQGRVQGYTLEAVCKNPLNYIGKDIRYNRIYQALEDTKKALIEEVIPAITERGEKLNELENKTIRLAEDANEFRDRAKKMNKCCSWF